MTIAVDFDGTIVTHEYPKIGEYIPFAIMRIRQFIAQGHKIILLTMRSGKTLEEAIQYCERVGIELWAVNENPTQKEWTNSPKIYANIYIDDAAFGCPLIFVEGKRPYVDWSLIKINPENRRYLR